MKQIVPTALLLSFLAQAQGTNAPYASMAPLDRYLIADRNAEITLAKSAAPSALSDNADVMVLELQGYKTAAKGTNGFVCMVERSWTAPFGDPEFWNPKIRGPICFNPPAARTYLPISISRTQLALAGKSETQMRDAINSALDKRELPALEAGHVLHALEAGLSWGSGWAFPSAPDVLGRANETRILGCGDAGFSHHRQRGDSRPVNDLHHPRRQVVRRHVGFPRPKMTVDPRRGRITRHSERGRIWASRA